MFATVLLFLVLASCSGLVSCRLGKERLKRPVPRPEGPPLPGRNACDDDGDLPPSPRCNFPGPVFSFGDFIEFHYEGSPQGGCETMHFGISAYAKDKLESRVITNVEYFYSLTGLVSRDIIYQAIT